MCFDHATVLRKVQRRCKEMYHEPVNDNDNECEAVHLLTSAFVSFLHFLFTGFLSCLHHPYNPVKACGFLTPLHVL